MSKRRDFATCASFVSVWQHAQSIQGVCEVTGLAPKTALSFAHTLRKNGVPLKQFGRRPGWKPLGIDYAALADLARQLAPTN